MADQRAPGVSNVSEHASLALVNHQLVTMRQDMRDMKEAVQAMAEVITKTGLIERDLEHFKAGQDRAFTAIAKVEARQESDGERITALQTASVNTARTSSWVDRGLLGVFVFVAMAAAKALGLT